MKAEKILEVLRDLTHKFKTDNVQYDDLEDIGEIGDVIYTMVNQYEYFNLRIGLNQLQEDYHPKIKAIKLDTTHYDKLVVIIIGIPFLLQKKANTLRPPEHITPVIILQSIKIF